MFGLSEKKYETLFEKFCKKSEAVTKTAYKISGISKEKLIEAHKLILKNNYK